MRSLVFSTALVTVLFGSSTTTEAQPLPADSIRAIAAGALGEVPGLTVAVGRDGEVVWSEAFGRAALEPARPATSESRFRVYSVSKPWTATVALRLAGKGRLDPRAPIDVSGFPDKGAPITPYQLGTHTAGIRHYREGEAETGRACATVAEAVSIFADDPLVFEPGTDRGYSTWGFVLLSRVIEEAADEPFPGVLQREVLEPAGMDATAHAGREVARARAYEREPDGSFRDVTDTTDPSCKWGGGGYLSTAADLARFPLAVLGGRLLPPEGAALVLDPGEGSVHRTGGSGPGGTAHVRTDVESGVVVALAANAGDALATLSELADRIAATVDSEPAPPTR